MGALLETEIKNAVASALSGQLLSGTLRRVAISGKDAFGDPVDGAATTFSFDGIVDSFNAAFAAAAGIKVTDARILIIAGSLSTTPTIDDQVKIRDTWYQLRTLVERDPANATFVFAGFSIPDPT